ncbi:MAG: beta-galactosidase [Chloroflexi bacterium]|jgi:beta-galactosidase|nr:beta-galactosidase [Chloroflexota bacterium]
MYIGADYYPEHWPRERWETDARMMQEAGFNIVRLAEFAWINMEPQEGTFEFGWLDEALETLDRHGIRAVLCTPTAVMPAWIARKYPETLAMQQDGTRIVWGVRKNNCFTSGAYRLLSERITRAMAEHFRDAPNVIGWQTDNEFGGPVCYCDTCRSAFQDWLRAKYGSLDELNRAWGTHFWGHLYRTWGEIIIPVDPSTHNPSACLDWQRFGSWLNVRFQRDQVRILREVCPQHFVTHNFMGLFHELDYYDLAEDLDHVSWDNYPVWGPPSVPYLASEAADVMRGLKKKNFWIMEQTSGPGGWGAYGRNPRPGEIRKVAFQQVAHGADAVVWFRWRACTAGREQYWHGILGHDGKGLRRYKECAQTATDLHGLSAALEGTTVKPSVAIIYDYDSIWAVRIQPGYAGNTYHAAMDRLYQALFRAGVNVDFIRSTDDLSPYRVVLAPDLYVLPDRVAESLRQYVQNGGVLLADSRFGVKDETNLCHARTLPGLLSDALGIAIEEYESLGQGDETQSITYKVLGLGALSGSYTAAQTAEWVQPQTAETLARYGEWHMQPYAALTRNRYGQGWGYFLGTVIQEPGFYDALIAELLERAGIAAVVKPPAGVEASIREGNGRRLLFLINHTEQPQTVTVPAGQMELLTQTETGHTLTLDRYGVAVVQLA